MMIETVMKTSAFLLVLLTISTFWGSGEYDIAVLDKGTQVEGQQRRSRKRLKPPRGRVSSPRGRYAKPQVPSSEMGLRNSHLMAQDFDASLRTISYSTRTLPAKPSTILAYRVSAPEVPTLDSRYEVTSSGDRLLVADTMRHFSLLPVSMDRQSAISMARSEARRLGLLSELELARSEVSTATAGRRRVSTGERYLEAYFVRFTRTIDGMPCRGGGGMLQMTISGNPAGVVRAMRVWRPLTDQVHLSSRDLRSPRQAIQNLHSNRIRLAGEDLADGDEDMSLVSRVTAVRLCYVSPGKGYTVGTLLPAYEIDVTYTSPQGETLERTYQTTALTTRALNRFQSGSGLEVAIHSGLSKGILDSTQATLALAPRPILWQDVELSPILPSQYLDGRDACPDGVAESLDASDIKVRIWWASDKAHDLEGNTEEGLRDPLEDKGYGVTCGMGATAQSIIDAGADYDVIILHAPAAVVILPLLIFPSPAPGIATWINIKPDAARILKPDKLIDQFVDCRTKFFFVRSCCQMKEIAPWDIWNRWYEMMGVNGVHAVIGYETFVADEANKAYLDFWYYLFSTYTYTTGKNQSQRFRTLHEAMMEWVSCEDITIGERRMCHRIHWSHPSYIDKDYFPGVHLGASPDTGSVELWETWYEQTGPSGGNDAFGDND